MQRINQDLLEELQKKLDLRKSRVYDLIQQKVTETYLPRHLAAIALAADNGINIAKYATAEELAAISGVRPPQSGTPSSGSPVIQRRTVKVVEPISLDLSFVSSKDLDKILRRDLEELNVAYSQGLRKTAKTCMVLSGSITEALLLDALMQNKTLALAAAKGLPKKLSSNPEDWGLYDMVTIAMNMAPPLLPTDAETGADQLRKWRNLIHPGRELKETRKNRIEPTSARARNAIAFLQFIAEELGR